MNQSRTSSRLAHGLRVLFIAKAIVLAGGFVNVAHAGVVVQEFGPFDDGEIAWEQAVGSWETIDFTEVPVGTFLTDEYLPSDGVTFPSSPQVLGPSFGVLVHDGFGISSDIDGRIEIAFEVALKAIAFDLPGSGDIEFFDGDKLVAGPLSLGFPGIDWFSGYISDVPFDRVVLDDSDELVIDDLRYAMVVPVPGVMTVLVVSSLTVPGRRRRS